VSTPPIRLPAGVRDFLPRAAARRRSLATRVLDVFEAWGYARIITPAFECAAYADLSQVVLAKTAGRDYQVSIPTDACRHYQREALDALHRARGN